MAVGRRLADARDDRMVGEEDGSAANRRTGTPVLTLKKLRVEEEFWRQARDVPKEERVKFGSTVWNLMRLDGGPKVKIEEMVGAEQSAPLDYRHEPALIQSLNYYHGKDDAQRIAVLKFYVCYLLQQARKATDPSRQLFQVFKAMDLLRMICQYSPFCINVQAETMVGQLWVDLGTQLSDRFRRQMECEAKIIPIVRQLKNYPGDHENRLYLAQFFTKQGSFADALAQYDVLLRIYPKVAIAQDVRRAIVWIKLGKLFEDMLPPDLPNQMGDSRKLKAFIERYNRDFKVAGIRLPLFDKRLDNPGLQRLRQLMYRIAIHWYEQAIKVSVIDRKMLSELALKVGEHYVKQKRYKTALSLLMSVNDSLGQSRKSLEMLEQRMRFLQLVRTCAHVVKKKVTESWAKEEIERLQPTLDEMREAAAEIEKNRAAIQARRQQELQEFEEEDDTPAWKRQAPARRTRRRA